MSAKVKKDRREAGTFPTDEHWSGPLNARGLYSTRQRCGQALPHASARPIGTGGRLVAHASGPQPPRSGLLGQQVPPLSPAGPRIGSPFSLQSIEAVAPTGRSTLAGGANRDDGGQPWQAQCQRDRRSHPPSSRARCHVFRWVAARRAPGQRPCMDGETASPFDDVTCHSALAPPSHACARS